MPYKENPKTTCSGIVCAIPQKNPRCPHNCEDCFYQSGQSYLEPLAENLPNVPDLDQAEGRVVRVNDGLDSNVEPELCENATRGFRHKFYNTSSPKNLEKFDAPVVLTVNPGKTTDEKFHRVEAPTLMFVRFRTNTWNLVLLEECVKYYGARHVPIVATWMAYSRAESIPNAHKSNYVYRTRTLNPYFAIKTDAWRRVVERYYPENHRFGMWFSSCGKVEGVGGGTACRHCGVCLREYFATAERLRGRI